MKKLAVFLISLVAVLNMSAKKSALIVGIGKYDTGKTGFNRINGDRDVALLSGKLSNIGFKVESLVNERATKRNVVSAIKKLVNNAKSGDIVYIQFSCHGQQIPDKNKDEKSGYDQALVCYDACSDYSFKIKGKPYYAQNHLIDDELFPHINNLKIKVGAKGKVYVVFDSCYSGTAFRDEEELMELETDEPVSEEDKELYGDVRSAGKFVVREKDATDKYLRQLKKPGAFSKSGGTVVIISACSDNQKNHEYNISGSKYGSLSFCIAKMLDEKIPLDDWYQFFLNRKYKKYNIETLKSQTPQVHYFK